MSNCQGLEGNRDRRKMVVAIKGQCKGSLWWWKYSVYWLYQDINSQRVILYYSFARWYHWGKLVKDTCDLCIITYTCMWIYNYLKIKHFFLKRHKKKAHSLGLHNKNSFKKKSHKLRSCRAECSIFHKQVGGLNRQRIAKGQYSIVAESLDSKGCLLKSQLLAVWLWASYSLCA